MLFLFDIDGTLLRRTPPVHRQAICDAASTIYGVRLGPQELGETAGMTDTAIIRRALLAAGLPADTIEAGLAAFFSTAADVYERSVPDDLSAYHTPHAHTILEWLASQEAALALVTGNIQRIAWVKLRAAGLAHFFACGGFGDEAEAREKLPPLALQRSRVAFARDFHPTHTYVIGDTPADVACGAACALRTVAVATGPIHSIAQLRASGADHVFEDLSGLRTLPFGSD